MTQWKRIVPSSSTASTVTWASTVHVGTWKTLSGSSPSRMRRDPDTVMDRRSFEPVATR